jgi:hypothetical protein
VARHGRGQAQNSAAEGHDPSSRPPRRRPPGLCRPPAHRPTPRTEDAVAGQLRPWAGQAQLAGCGPRERTSQPVEAAAPLARAAGESGATFRSRPRRCRGSGAARPGRLDPRRPSASRRSPLTPLAVAAAQAPAGVVARPGRGPRSALRAQRTSLRSQNSQLAAPLHRRAFSTRERRRCRSG